MSSASNEQRINLKFLVKLNKTPTECFNLLKQVYGDESLSRARVFEWHKRFSDGRDSVEDNERPGRPVTASTSQKIARISEMVREDRRLSIRMIGERLGIDKETVRKILHDDLNMSKVCAKLVPKNLSADQKLMRLRICSDVLEQFDNDPSMEERIITCDETWIFQYDVETKRQSMHWKSPASPRSKKGRMSKSKFKAMLIVFFDINGIIMIEWVPEGQTVNQHYYLEVLAKLRERVRKKRPDLWKNKSWVLHQDNAPAHNALSVKQFLADKQIPVLDHPPYSPDLAPCDYFLFPKVKSVLKGTHFESMEAVKQKTAELLRALSDEDFKHCFEQWKKRMQRCINSGGEYIEGEKCFDS